MSYVPEGITLSQKKFTNELLKDCHLTNTKTTSTLLPLNCKLDPIEGDPVPDPTYYTVMVGTLNFLTNTRPGINFIAQTLS